MRTERLTQVALSLEERVRTKKGGKRNDTIGRQNHDLEAAEQDGPSTTPPNTSVTIHHRSASRPRVLA